jgi:hypothetical protein
MEFKTSTSSLANQITYSSRDSRKESIKRSIDAGSFPPRIRTPSSMFRSRAASERLALPRKGFHCERRVPMADTVDRCQSRRTIHSKDVTTLAR